jgi:hypothetical protein
MENLIVEKWAPLLQEEAVGMPKVGGQRTTAAAMMLEAQSKYINEEVTNVTGDVAKWDPILIGMVRRTIPKLIPMDVAGVQPMTGPSGLIFSMISRYDNRNGVENVMAEPKTTQSGDPAGTQANSIFGGDFGGTNKVDFANGYLTAMAEQLGTGGTNPDYKEMAFTISKHSIIADTRALKAQWSTELEQDMRSIHGMSAENELVNILNTEIAAEINREFLRKMYFVAKLGAQNCTTPGIFDLNVDGNGRWSVEKFKGLLFQIEIERNRISYETKRGKGNFIICSGNVASALAMTGLLDNVATSQLANGINYETNGSTFAGKILSGVSVYVDPYYSDVANGEEFVLVGYTGNFTGSGSSDSGMYYCPYTPIELTKVVDPKSFNPAVGLKTRHAFAQNPLATGNVAIDTAAYRKNPYFRIMKVTNVA